MTEQISGIHHITAVAGEPQQNIDFYTGVLGLRLVKVTVNFDDPGNYHFYYGDAHGSPGAILTFFSWPGARHGRSGNSQVTAASFAVPESALAFWKQRLEASGVSTSEIVSRFGQPVLPFHDPDGLQLELIERAASHHGALHPGIPPECAIQGFHSATLTETGYERTAALLTQTMGLHLVEQDGSRFRYGSSGPSPGDLVDVVCAPGGVDGRIAVGAVHHIAWRTPDDDTQLEWLAEISKLGYNVSPVMDRTYFHSIYFREPGSILFEIATDVPGFEVDESFENLGSALMLPPWLEAQRPRIERLLPKIERPA